MPAEIAGAAFLRATLPSPGMTRSSAPSALLSLFGAASGASMRRRFGPAGLLLLTTLRLPLGADLYLITTLQRVTARAASATLDTFDVVHYLGGEIAEVVPNTADRAWWLGEGQYFWQDPGTTRSIKNIGTTPVEFVEFELK